MKTPATRLLLAAALLLGNILPATAADQTATWNSTTGNWSDFTKWSTNPNFANNGNGGFTFDAIQTGGDVTVNQAITIEKYNLSGGTNTGAGFTLTLNDLLTFSGGGMSGSGTVNANGGATFSGSAVSVHNSRGLNLGGTSTWSGGSISLNGTSSLVNTAGGVFTTNFDGFINSSGTFTNAGTFTKSGGSGTTSIQTAFSNTGTVNVNSGTLSLVSNSSHSGALSVAGGTLQFGAGTHNLNSGTTFSGAGTISVAGNVSLNTAVSSGASTTFSLAGGTLLGAGALTVNGPMTWTGGSIDGSGLITANDGATFSGAGKSLNGTRQMNLGGTSTWSGGSISLNGTSSLVNTAGGVFTTNFDGFINSSGTFTNAGTFTKSGGTVTTSIQTSFSNTGTVNVSSGTLALDGTVTQHSGTTLTGGTWNVTNGASISRTAGSNITTLGSAASVTLDGAGSSFAKVTTALATNQGSFTLKNNRDLTTAGAYANSGTTRVEDSTTVLTVNGAYTQTAGVTAMVGGAFIDPTVFNLNGGTLQGTGTIESSVIAGPGSHTIAPGMSPGTLTINGNLILSSGSTLAMELGGLTQGSLYDHLDVNGTLTLAGMLDLDFINDFQNSLTNGEFLTLATAESAILGSFSNVASGGHLLTNFPFALQVWYGAGSPFGAENLVVVVPEPSRALLMMLGGMAVLHRRRRSMARPA